MVHCLNTPVGKNNTMMISKAENQITFCRSAVINITQEATTLINTHLWAACYSLAVQLCQDRCSSIAVCACQSRLAHFNFHRWSIPFHSSLLQWDRCSIFPSVGIGAPLLHSTLHTSLSAFFIVRGEHMNSHQRSWDSIVTSIHQSAVWIATLLGASPVVWILGNHCQHSFAQFWSWSIAFCTPYPLPWFSTSLLVLVRLRLNLAIVCLILHFSNFIFVPLFST